MAITIYTKDDSHGSKELSMLFELLIEKYDAPKWIITVPFDERYELYDIDTEKAMTFDSGLKKEIEQWFFEEQIQNRTVGCVFLKPTPMIYVCVYMSDNDFMKFRLTWL